MARFDSIGMFWEEHDVVKTGRSAPARVMPEIPDTGWKKLRDLPNLAHASILSVDVETNDESIEAGFGPGWGRGIGNIAGISVGADDDGRWYFPIRHTIRPEENYDPQLILAYLDHHLGTTPLIPKCGANLLYDIGWLAQEGVRVVGKMYDVQFAEALLDSDAFVALDVLAGKYLGEHKTGDTVFQWCMDFYGGKLTDQRKNLWRAPGSLVAPYGIGDADLPIRILERQWPLLVRQGLLPLFEMECGLIPLLVAMRFGGVPVDVKRAEQVRDQMLIKEKHISNQLKELVGWDLQTNSSDNLAKAFTKFGIPFNYTEPSKNFPKGRPSFTKDFLNTVQHPVAALIRDKRKWEKARSTFVEGYILNSHVNGRIFPSIHPLKSDENGTVTGRFSMSNPNGQNLSAKDEEIGALVRGCFVPRGGHRRWRKYDWSQLQYRFLAHYAVGAGAEGLRQRYTTDPKADYHAMVQTIVKEVTGKEVARKPIKNVNFGVVFGMGEEHTCEIMGLPMEQAAELLAAIHTAAPYMKATLKHYSKVAAELGVIVTVLGRRTRFNLWEPSSFQGKGVRAMALPREQAEAAYGHRLKRAHTHKGLNYLLQGSEGDFMKLCMSRAWYDGVFAETGVPLLTVHDELDFSDSGESDEAFDYLQHDIMEQALKFKVPISVGCDLGANWGECL